MNEKFGEQSVKKATIERQTFEVDSDGFVNFGDVARGLLNQQSQYASRYIKGMGNEYPALGQDLRFRGNPDDYHSVRIHSDDIIAFVEKVRKYKSEQGGWFNQKK